METLLTTLTPKRDRSVGSADLHGPAQPRIPPRDHHRRFLQWDAAAAVQRYASQGVAACRREGQRLALDLFHDMATRVPAYRDFLARNGIVPAKVRGAEDLQVVPPIDKGNYIDAYPLPDRCWDGFVSGASMLSASSGSTGVPYLWLRGDEQTCHGAMMSEVIYREFFDVAAKPTLYLITFGMGLWIAGTYMLAATQWTAQKGLPITVATPGLNTSEVLKLVRLAGVHYHQIVLVGLPAFLKDIIDTGVAEGIDWMARPVRLLVSGESITERWRDYVLTRTGLDATAGVINLYGSADVGLMAHETTTSIQLRRLAHDDRRLCSALFGADRVPSLNQFDPRLRWFEPLRDELLVSVRAGIPLLRYNTKDVGSVLSFAEVQERLRAAGYPECLEAGSRPSWRLPMVYLFGRGKFSATLFGITLFPEYFKQVLDSRDLSSLVTGRFMAVTEENEHCGQQLRLRVELRPGSVPDRRLEQAVRETFIRELPQVSAEYRHLLGAVSERAHPLVTLHEFGDAAYFPNGIVRKTS